MSTLKIAAAATLLLAAAPALAQSTNSPGTRPHHASYGDDTQYRQPQGASVSDADSRPSNPYHRPHHANY